MSGSRLSRETWALHRLSMPTWTHTSERPARQDWTTSGPTWSRDSRMELRVARARRSGIEGEAEPSEEDCGWVWRF